MKTEIQIEDCIPIVWREDKRKSITNLCIKVGTGNICHEGKMTICFYDGSCFPTFPIGEWDKIKGMIDRMIIKAQHLEREDC